MNSLNANTANFSSGLQIGPLDGTQSGSGQGQQGISEAQLDKFLAFIINALLQGGNKAQEGQGANQGGDSGSGNGSNGQQGGQSKGLSPATQALMYIVSEMLQAQNGGGMGGGFGGGFGAGFGGGFDGGLGSILSFSNDTGSMQ
ncbi:XopA/Hpa1 family type III secretion system protein [Xanthomonas vasicola]|uniref:XopA/Hpa1 family type III secretion system protein n=1 Tax=Xanthomonas vasicola TaxID=56459 RepID=UPI00034532F9|nr:XopA/Hpa1 family type III secretion system protein [Xanthomonas vasicola]KFA27024.1 hypothetical protein KWG_0122730 [Xanthomonas vasicola pv. vasculorum NCPPB 1381]